jgi:hypothetical protein
MTEQTSTTKIPNMNYVKQNFKNNIENIKKELKANNILQKQKKIYVGIMLKNILERYNLISERETEKVSKKISVLDTRLDTLKSNLVAKENQKI